MAVPKKRKLDSRPPEKNSQGLDWGAIRARYVARVKYDYETKGIPLPPDVTPEQAGLPADTPCSVKKERKPKKKYPDAREGGRDPGLTVKVKPEDREMVVKLYTEQQWTPTVLAEHFKVSASTISNILNAAGVERNQRPKKGSHLTHCTKAGHPLEVEGVDYYKRPDGSRQCRPCRLANPNTEEGAA